MTKIYDSNVINKGSLVNPSLNSPGSLVKSPGIYDKFPLISEGILDEILAFPLFPHINIPLFPAVSLANLCCPCINISYHFCKLPLINPPGSLVKSPESTIKFPGIPDRSPQNSINNYGDWLKSLPWTFFCTGTTRYELTLNSARRLAERFYSAIKNQSEDVRMFWAAEPFDVKEGHHIHFLTYIKGNPGEGLFNTLVNLWQWCTGNKVLFIEAGTNRIEWNKLTWNAIHLRSYDEKRGASGYCAKYINKRKADYDFLYNPEDPLMSACNRSEADYCPSSERKRRTKLYHIGK